MSEPYVFGVDEAGRGPLIGPMTLAVVGVDRAAADHLIALGVSDSKRYGSTPSGRRKRAELATAIAECVPTHAVRIVSVAEIDAHVERGELNLLERKVARELLDSVGAQSDAEIICDGARVFGPLRGDYTALVAVDKGESAHVSVAAASVLAKHARDEAFGEIAARYASQFGPLGGGGYINPATRDFIARYREAYGDLPPEARRSWRIAF